MVSPRQASDEVGDLLESEEGDAKREDDAGQVHAVAGQGGQGLGEESGILEVSEHPEVGDDAEDQRKLAGWAGPGGWR